MMGKVMDCKNIKYGGFLLTEIVVALFWLGWGYR
jgi:hypothetical protein